MIISFLQRLSRPLFGDFEREEFQKFLRMGIIFTFIIGTYWTLRPLKGAVFANLAGAANLPWAKTASILCLFPLVMLYTKLLDRFNREKMFYILAVVYCIVALVFALLLANSIIGQDVANIVAARTGLAHWGTQILAYTWYVFVESYGSLIVALFWAIASDITKPESAKKGFPLIVAVGQAGGIFGPYIITRLPWWLGLQTSSLSVLMCALTTLMLIFLFRNFLKATPRELLTSYHGKNEETEEKEQEPGFFEGLKLLVSHNYLLGIFAILSFFEIIVTVFDFHFQTLASMQYSGLQLSMYLGNYAGFVNFVALLCLLLGVSNITRILGVGVALMLMPVIFCGAILAFYFFDHLAFLFWLMVSSKAINYALNGPAIKQLYIPTTHDVRFKSQAWIETFGSRGAKEAGSIFNMALNPLQRSLGAIAGRTRHVLLSTCMGFAIVGLWFFIAMFLGKKYKKAIETNKVVC